MNESNLTPIQIEDLSFDDFPRNPQIDIVCVAPIRTIVRREEEILLIRRVRKVEEIDASVACPVSSFQVTEDPQTTLEAPAIQGSGEIAVHANQEYDSNATFTNNFDRAIVVQFMTSDDQEWNYGGTPGHSVMVSADGHLDGDVRSARFQGIPPAALVAVKGDQAVAHGKHQTVTLQPGETVYFVNNDQLGYYGDNTGTLRVNWSIVG